MPKKDFAQDAINAFDLPARPLPKSAPRRAVEEATPNPTQKPIPIKKNNSQNVYTRRTIYISVAQYNALRLLAATSGEEKEKDISAIVRSAIDFYLKQKTL